MGATHPILVELREHDGHSYSKAKGGEMAGSELLGTSYRRWGEYLLAILIGNAIYFSVIEGRLPVSFHHQLFQLDLGLLIDFLVCAGIYGLACLAHGL